MEPGGEPALRRRPDGAAPSALPGRDQRQPASGVDQADRGFRCPGAVYTTTALFPEDRLVPVEVARAIQIRLSEFEVQRPRQWGACWLALWLWELLELDKFWGRRLLPSREGTRWDLILAAMTAYRLIEPGSEWRLHRHWFGTTALGDLLGPEFSLGSKDNLYRCLDSLLKYKGELFSHLRQRWADLFAARFDVLLYDLTSTYFESDPPWDRETSAVSATVGTSVRTVCRWFWRWC